jgi:protein-S-isoprenylcysteine O-methyltransferase Ste14
MERKKRRTQRHLAAHSGPEIVITYLYFLFFSHTVDDPGFNFTLSHILISFAISTLAIVVLLVLICWQRMRMADKRSESHIHCALNRTIIVP